MLLPSPQALCLPTNAFVSSSIPAGAIASAGTIVVADAVGCGLMYLVGRFMGNSYTKTQSTDQSFWENVKTKNTNRFIPRTSIKLLGATLLILMGRFHASLTKTTLPSLAQMLLFSCWYSSMGLADEFDDLPEPLKTKSSRRFESISKFLLAAPIPFLMLWNPTLYVSFALYQLTSHTLSGKIDTKGLQLTAAMGFVCAVFISTLYRVKLPLVGMMALTLSNFVWQIHDEHVLLIKLTEKYPILAKLWDIFSFHTIMVILVALGGLPLSWLSVQSPGYAAAKLGIADGCLQLTSSSVKEATIFRQHPGHILKVM